MAGGEPFGRAGVRPVGLLLSAPRQADVGASRVGSKNNVEFDLRGRGGREFPPRARELRQEARVVRDEEQRAGGFGERRLQAFDRGEVEMVRRLVHHDEVGAARDAAREEDLADLAGARRRGGEEAGGARPQARDERHDAAEGNVVEPLEFFVDAARFILRDFLGNVEEAFLRDKDLRQQMAQKRGLAEAVRADEGDAVVGADLEGGVDERAPVAEVERAGGHVEDVGPLGDARIRKRDAEFVVDADGGVGGGELRGALAQFGALGEAPAVLALELRDAAQEASVVVVGGGLAFLEALRAGGGLFGGLAALLGGGGEAAGLAGVRVVAFAGVGLLAAVLFTPLGDATGAHCRVGWKEEEALRAEGVEEIAVVGDDEPGAVVVLERVEENGLAGGVEVVRGLVEGEHVGGAPEGEGDLGALALAVAEGVPALRPVFADAEAASFVEGGGVPAVHEVVPADGRGVGALDGVAGRAELADGAVRRREGSGGQFEEGRLAGAVRADDARPSAFGEEGGDVREQRRRHAGVGEGDGVELEEACHARSVAYSAAVPSRSAARS